MDIKGALNQVIPLNVRAKDNIQKSIKSDSTTDRDPNGQQAFGDQKQEHGPMSDDQIQKAMEHLRTVGVVKDNHLIVELVIVNDKKFVFLKEPTGKVIRRIPEHELWSLQIMEEDKRGQILNKSA
jgi:uncharacterized FlaG/YvyC family protein